HGRGFLLAAGAPPPYAEIMRLKLSQFRCAVRPLVLVLILCLWSLPAFAQGGGVLTPGGTSTPSGPPRPPGSAAPQPTVREGYPVWFGYLLMAVLGGGVIVVSLLPSKRSHQD